MRILGNTGCGDPEYLADSCVLHQNTLRELYLSGSGYFSFDTQLGGAVSYIDKRDLSRKVVSHTVKLKLVCLYESRRLVDKYYLIEDCDEAAKFAEWFGKKRKPLRPFMPPSQHQN